MYWKSKMTLIMKQISSFRTIFKL